MEKIFGECNSHKAMGLDLAYKVPKPGLEGHVDVIPARETSPSPQSLHPHTRTIPGLEWSAMYWNLRDRVSGRLGALRLLLEPSGTLELSVWWVELLLVSGSCAGCCWRWEEAGGVAGGDIMACRWRLRRVLHRASFSPLRAFLLVWYSVVQYFESRWHGELMSSRKSSTSSSEMSESVSGICSLCSSSR